MGQMKLQIERRLLPDPGPFEEAMGGATPGTQQPVPTPLWLRGFEKECRVACYL